ncbi:MAG: glycosyltransferase family 39 protein [Candidatus Daviesbacteria bacterium]|nr:MAG: glycosyltransferase family 39 protein [Candidatus Daviesbacteria bacterium]
MIYLILAVALILRLISLNQSLWLDEAINVVNAQNLNLLTFLTQYPIGDFHPPGYFLLLWLWGRLFGFSEISVRIPSLFLGVGTIWLVYLLGKELFNKKIGALAALLLAVAPLHVYYSQEARMYSFAAFAVALNSYFFVRLLKNKLQVNLGFIGEAKNLFVFSGVLVIYSDYLAYLIFPAQFLYLLFFQKDKLKNYLKVGSFVLVSFLIWLPFFYQQLLNGLRTANLVPGWAEVVGGVSIKNLGLIFAKTVLGRVSFDDKIFYSVVVMVVGLIYGAVIINALRKVYDQLKLVLFLTAVPLILATIISFFVPVLSYFRLLFILPFFYLLVAKGVENLAKQFKIITILSLLLISLSCLYFYYTNPKFQREDWRGAVSTVENLAQKNQGVAVFESNGNLSPFEYYSRGQKWLPGLRKLPAYSENDTTKFVSVNNIYLFEYLVDITDPGKNLEKNLTRQGFNKKEVYNFNGVGLITHYSRL